MEIQINLKHDNLNIDEVVTFNISEEEYKKLKKTSKKYNCSEEQLLLYMIMNDQDFNELDDDNDDGENLK